MAEALSEAAPESTAPTSPARDESGAAPDTPERAAPTREGQVGENEDTLLATEGGAVEVLPPRDSASLSNTGVCADGVIELSEEEAVAFSPTKVRRPVAFGPRSASLANVDVNRIVARLEARILMAKENLLKERQREKVETLLQNDEEGGLCSEGTVERYERELSSLRQSFEEMKELEKEMHRIMEEDCREEQSRSNNTVGVLESTNPQDELASDSLVEKDAVESVEGLENATPKLLEEHNSRVEGECEVLRKEIKQDSQQSDDLKQSDASLAEQWQMKRKSIVEEYVEAQSRVSEKIMLLEDWIKLLEREAESPAESVASVQDNFDDFMAAGVDVTGSMERSPSNLNLEPLSAKGKASKQDAVEWTEDKVQEMKDASGDTHCDDMEPVGFEKRGIVGSSKERAIGGQGASVNVAGTVTSRTRNLFGMAISKTKNTVCAAAAFFKDRPAVTKRAEAGCYGDSLSNEPSPSCL